MQIRKKMFETNSSSSHSIVISHGDIFAPDLTKEEKGYGIIKSFGGDFGWDFDTFSNFRDKLKYLCTFIGCSKKSIENGDAVARWEGGHLTPDQVNEKENMLKNCIRNVTGCELEIIPMEDGYFEYGYIDHQSDDLPFEIFESEENVKQFLFCNDSILHTGNDNV